MTITVELRPDVEASEALSSAARAQAWRESVKDLPYSPPLTDDAAISRDSIYE